MTVLVCITRVSRQILRRRDQHRNKAKSPKIDHRYNLPFDFMDVLEADSDPLVFPLVVGRGFLLELAASDDGRGAASFITIFAWISSSLVALTFLGQNSVTNVQRCRRHLSRSSPAACLVWSTCSIRRPMAARESFKMATLSSRGISSPDSLSCFSCFFTGRNSSLVAASSIDGHSSDDSESVNVGVGRRLRFLVEVSSTDATASLSARLFRLLVVDDDATTVGGGVAETFSCPLFRKELSYERNFSSCSRNIPRRKSPRRTR